MANPTTTKTKTDPAVAAEVAPPVRLALGMRDSARAVGLPYTTFRDIVQRDGIPFISYGQGGHKPRYLFRICDLERWLADHLTTNGRTGRQGEDHARGQEPPHSSR